MFRVSMFRLCLAIRCRCGIESAPFGLRGAAKVLPQGGPTMRRRTDRSVSSPCMRPSSCQCSFCRSPPTRIDLGPWSGRPCREAQASGFEQVRASLDFALDVQIDQQLVACQTKGSPSASPRHRPLTLEQNACSRPQEMCSAPARCGTRQLPNRTSLQPRCCPACS